MKKWLTFLLTFCALHFMSVTHAQNPISPDDLSVLQGAWTGSLTYVDYGSGKPYTMPANLVAEQGNNVYQFVLQISYPNEPHANSKEKIRISKDGSQLNKTDITSTQVLPNGLLQIITEYSGKDNNQDAFIRNTYILGAKDFILRKHVKFQNEEWLMRNEYKFTR